MANIYYRNTNNTFTQLTATDFGAATPAHTHSASTITGTVTVGQGGVPGYYVSNDYMKFGIMQASHDLKEYTETLYPIVQSGIYYCSDSLVDNNQLGTLSYLYGGTSVTSTTEIKESIGGLLTKTGNSVWNPDLSSWAGYSSVIVPGEITGSTKTLYFVIPFPQELSDDAAFTVGTTDSPAALGIDVNCWKSDRSGYFAALGSQTGLQSGLPRIILKSNGDMIYPTAAFDITGSTAPTGTKIGTWTTQSTCGYLRYTLTFTYAIGNTYKSSPATVALNNSICTVECSWVRYRNTYSS